MNDDKVESQLKSSSLIPSSSDTVNLVMDPVRARRATSVQRQTDTLRRLARSRDVTPMLQTPPNPYVPGNRSINPTNLEQSYSISFSGQPPPPPWMSASRDNVNAPNQVPMPGLAMMQASPAGSLSQFIIPGIPGESNRASINAGTLDTLSSRPAPPPYNSSGIPQLEEDGTYLV